MNQETIIVLLTDARDSLIRTAQAVPEDKLNWRPMEAGRTVLDALGDAAQAPALLSQVLESRGKIMPSREIFQQMREERASWSREDAIQHLQANCEKLFALIRALSEEELAREIHLPIHGGTTRPLAAWIMMTYRSLISRFAQINYIQTLYGDTEMH